MRQLESMLRLPWTVTVEYAEDGIVLSVEEIPGFFAAGRTAEEAEANFWDALASHLSSFIDEGDDIPEPRQPLWSTFGESGPEADVIPVRNGIDCEEYTHATA